MISGSVRRLAVIHSCSAEHSVRHETNRQSTVPSVRHSVFKIVFPSRDLVSFDLERIVEIRIAAAEADPEADQQVGGNHERSPAFVLPDVDSFVTPRHPQAVLVAAQHDMPQRNGGNRPAHPERASQDFRQATAKNLQDSINDLQSSTCENGDGNKQQSDHRAGKRPDVEKGCPPDEFWRSVDHLRILVQSSRSAESVAITGHRH